MAVKPWSTITLFCLSVIGGRHVFLRVMRSSSGSVTENTCIYELDINVDVGDRFKTVDAWLGQGWVWL